METSSLVEMTAAAAGAGAAVVVLSQLVTALTLPLFRRLSARLLLTVSLSKSSHRGCKVKHSIIKFDHVCAAADCQAVPAPTYRGIGMALSCARCKFVADAEALLTGRPDQEVHDTASLKQHVTAMQPEVLP